MRDCTGMDVSAQTGGRRVTGRPAPVSVRFAREAGVARTLEGPVPYEAGDALITGQADEQWPVERARFFDAYAPQAPAEAGGDGWYVKLPRQVWAIRIHEAFEVRLKRKKALLRGAPGDWLVQYGPDDYGVVRADLFVRIYEENP